MKRLFLLLFLSLSPLLGCHKEGKKLVAIVNNIKIYEDEIKMRLKENGISLKTLAKNSKLYRTLFAEKLKESIEIALILSSYPELVTTFSEAEIKQELFRNYRENELKLLLQEEGIDFSMWKQIHRKDAIAFMILKKILKLPKEIDTRSKIQTTQEEEEEKIPYVKIQQILTKDRKTALKAMQRIRKGDNFETLAKEFSTAPEKGSVIGPFFPGELPPEFDICFKMEKGEISPIVKSPYGYHIFKVVEKGFSAGRFSKNEIAKKIKEETAWNEAYLKLIEQLKKKAKIEIFTQQL